MSQLNINLSILDEFFRLHEEGATGVWVGFLPDGKTQCRMLMWERGRVVHAISKVRGEGLKDVLVQSGTLSPSDLQRVLAQEISLVRQIGPSAFRAGVQQVAIRMITGMLLSKKPTAFHASPIPPAGRVEGLDSNTICLQGLLGASRAFIMLGKLQPDAQKFVSVDLMRVNGVQIPNDLKTLMTYLDGSRTVNQTLWSFGGITARGAGLLLFLRDFLGALVVEDKWERTPYSIPVPSLPEERGIAAGVLVPPTQEEPQVRILERPAEVLELSHSMVTAEIVQDEPRVMLCPVKHGPHLGLVIALPLKEEIIESFGLSTIDVKKLEEEDQRMALLASDQIDLEDTGTWIERLDPTCEPYAQEFKAPSIPWVRIALFVVGLTGAVVGGTVWVLRRPAAPAPIIKPVGDVEIDTASRVRAIQNQEFRVALAQGQKYLAKLQRSDMQWTIRLGIACDGDKVLELLQASGSWQEKEPFLMPVQLESGSCYQVLEGAYGTQKEAADALQALADALPKDHSVGLKPGLLEIRSVPLGM